MDRQRAASIDGSDSLEGDGLPFYPSQSPSLRRSMGSSRQSNEVAAGEDARARETDVRGANDDFGRGLSRPQLEANRGRQRRPKRRSGPNRCALANRAIAQSAALDRHLRQQEWLIESFSQAILAQSTLLGRVAAGLRGESAVEREMERAFHGHQSGRGDSRPRRQPACTEVARRPNRRGRGRGRRQSSGGYRANSERYIEAADCQASTVAIR